MRTLSCFKHIHEGNNHAGEIIRNHRVGLFNFRSIMFHRKTLIGAEDETVILQVHLVKNRFRPSHKIVLCVVYYQVTQWTYHVWTGNIKGPARSVFPCCALVPRSFLRVNRSAPGRSRSLWRISKVLPGVKTVIPKPGLPLLLGETLTAGWAHQKPILCTPDTDT